MRASFLSVVSLAFVLGSGAACTAPVAGLSRSFACTRSDDCVTPFVCEEGACVLPEGGRTPTPVLEARPARGPVGTLVSLTGANLDQLTSVRQGQARGLVTRRSERSVFFMVMPGATSGPIVVATPDGVYSTALDFTVTPTGVPDRQQGPKLVANDAIGASLQGVSVAVSSDGNTALIGGWGDNPNIGAAWVWTRDAGVWRQQGPKLIGTGAVGGQAGQGRSVSLDADGTTALVGGVRDDGDTGAAWVWVRAGDTWLQQGPKLVPAEAGQDTYVGTSTALSADGDTALIGGWGDDNGRGAAWVFTRHDGGWVEQAKLVSADATAMATQGSSVALSADGNTALVGAHGDGNGRGAGVVWVRTGSSWAQQGPKLTTVGPDSADGVLGFSAALSADGHTAALGAYRDEGNTGAVWIFVRSGGRWTPQGGKLVGRDASGAGSNQGSGVALSADGNTLLFGAEGNAGRAGAVWVFTRTGTSWSQRGPLFSAAGVGVGQQGYDVALSSDGRTALSGAPGDNAGIGAAWVVVAE